MIEGSPMKLSASQKRRERRKTAREKERFKAFSPPITLEQVCDFSSKLVRVDYGTGEGCWLHTSKSVSGASKNYARFRHNGELAQVHRFALAVKLGCTLWDLEGYDAAHSSKVVCLGGRCCNPNHLTKKRSNPNRSWDRIKDADLFGDKAKIRTPEEIKAMLSAMYPTGIKHNVSLFDDPWQANVSPELQRFLGTALDKELQNMREDCANTGNSGQ
jgi:hypothetical protein